MVGKKVTGVAMAALLGLTLVPVVGAPAFAASNCSAEPEEKIRTGLPDSVRVKAKCTTLQADYHARGGLDVVGSPDIYTPWFTDTNTWHYSTWIEWPFRGAFVQTHHI